MLTALVVFATEAAEEPGSSHAAFYIAGLALAAWAVLVSVIGIRSADRFPPRIGTRNGVIGIGLLLVLATTASAVITG